MGFWMVLSSTRACLQYCTPMAAVLQLTTVLPEIVTLCIGVPARKSPFSDKWTRDGALVCLFIGKLCSMAQQGEKQEQCIWVCKGMGMLSM